MEPLARFALLTADEPPVRSDGRCAVCAKKRNPERSARYAPGCAEIDAFCSSDCARKWHGNPLPERSIWGRLHQREDAA